MTKAKKPKKIKGAVTIGILDSGETLLEVKNVLLIKKANGDMIFRDSEADYEISKVIQKPYIFEGGPNPSHFLSCQLQDPKKW